MAYRLERAEGGSLPTIVSRYGTSILAIDERDSGGKRVTTPVFATDQMAERVLGLLNESQDARLKLQEIEHLLDWWEARYEHGSVVREIRKILAQDYQ